MTDAPQKWSYRPPRAGKLTMHRHDYAGGHYWTGEFVTPMAAVSVYRDATVTMLDLLHGGSVHRWSWDRSWADRTIPRLAREMIANFVDLHP